MKRLLFIQTRGPYGTLYGREGLDAILMSSAFAETVVLFLGDGVLQLLKDQDPAPIGGRDYSATYGVLRDYGVDEVYASAGHLEDRRVTEDDLVIPVTMLSTQAITDLMQSADAILRF